MTFGDDMLETALQSLLEDPEAELGTYSFVRTMIPGIAGRGAEADRTGTSGVERWIGRAESDLVEGLEKLRYHSLSQHAHAWQPTSPGAPEPQRPYRNHWLAEPAAAQPDAERPVLTTWGNARAASWR